MAVVQYTAAVNQIRGKLNGSVFNKSRTIQTLQRKQQAPKGARGHQDLFRNIFSTVQRQWKDCTLQQKTDWQLCATNNPAFDRFGQQVTLSGYNQFIKCNVWRLTAAGTVLFSPLTDTAPAVAMTGITWGNIAYGTTPEGQTTLGTLTMASLAGGLTGIAVFVDVSLPVSPGVTAYHGTWHTIGTTDAADPFVVYNVHIMSSRFPVATQGQIMFKRLRVIDLRRGAILQEAIEQVPITGI